MRDIKWKELFDYVEKKVNSYGCKGKLTYTIEFCEMHNLSIFNVTEKLKNTGGFCDCEVILNSKDSIDENSNIEFDIIKETVKKKCVWKFHIESANRSSIHVPKDAKILAFKLQNNEPCIWFEFDIENKEKLQDRDFFLVGTGCVFDYENMKYIDTILMGDYVFHLYEELSTINKSDIDR